VSYRPPEDFYGHEAVPVVTYACGTCHRALTQTKDGLVHQPRSLDYPEWEKAKDKQRRADRLVAAIPYSGTIARCQTAVWEQGRAPHTWRCERKPTLVIESDSGPMAVCKQHASNPGSRWKPNGHFMERKGDPPGNEPIEPEPEGMLHCDYCTKIEWADDLTPGWNGETGNHLSCEPTK
jgi:hypothetical protein